MDDTGVPGFTADPKLQSKLDSLDNNLEPVNDEKDKTSAEQGKEDASDDKKAEQADEDKKSEDEAVGADQGDQESKEDSKADEDDGYTIDEGDDEEAIDDAPESKTEPDKAVDRSNLTPEQQYILDNISPIKVAGYVGDSNKLEVFDVLSPEQLPNGFRFADDRERAKATKDFAVLENKASELQSQYRNQENQKAAEEFKQREDTADRQDIAALQKSGDIPKFKAQPDSKEFDSDPGVKLVQEVLDFKEKKNADYYQQYEAGRPYRHIGFEEAYYMYKRENPTKVDKAQEREDDEREAFAKRTSNTKGTPAQERGKKPSVHSGMNSMDLERLIEQKTANW